MNSLLHTISQLAECIQKHAFIFHLPDWGVKVRSLHFDANSSYSGDLRYVCKTSASSGPSVHWRVYYADQAQWEDLDPSSGPGVDITSTSLSSCVVESVLVIGQARGPSSEGDIISCTATSGSINATAYLQGKFVHSWTTINPTSTCKTQVDRLKVIHAHLVSLDFAFDCY